MKHTDILVSNVKRTKNNELRYTVTVKEEDYSIADFEVLRGIWQEGTTLDVELGDAAATHVNPATGEITSTV